MKYLKVGIILVALAFLAVLFTFKWKNKEAQQEVLAEQSVDPIPISFAVEPRPSIPLVQRIGVNLSFWSTWGAEQYMRNVLMNPGFEGRVDRVVVIVNQTDGQSFSDGQGLGQTDNHWNGATYEVRSGRSVGATGTISHSLKLGANGLPQYFTDGPTPTLAVNDVVVITKTENPNPIAQWWINQSAKELVKVHDSARPGSTGKHSILLLPQLHDKDQLSFYLDSITSRAGKLLLVQGPWRLSFWARGEGENPVLEVIFRRLNNTSGFLHEEIALSNDWKEYTINFNGEDNGAAEALKLAFRNVKDNTQVLIDDVFLGPAQDTNPHTAWRQDVIDMLKELRPSYIRDWQGQLGDSLNNRIADVYERGSWISRGFGSDGSPSFGYSIPDLLDLCTQVQANPWIIIPPTLTDRELDALGVYLAQHANKSQFSEVILEFGNENWNGNFRSGAVSVPEAHGPVADRAFDRIAATSGPNVKIRRVINGHFSDPKLTRQFATETKHYDTLAVAPYCFQSMSKGMTDSQALKELFKSDDALFQEIASELAPLNKTLAAYEVNLHTMSGSATSAQRNRIVPSAAGGAALAKRLIEGMHNKASPQMVFCLAQFDANPIDVQGLVRLWGICRDVCPTKQWRPTGLATKLLNEVASGSLHKLNVQKGKDPLPVEAHQISLAAFRNGSHWATAAVNANNVPVALEVEFPEDHRALPTVVKRLDADKPLDNNEESLKVRIVDQPLVAEGRKVQYILPPYSFCVFTAPKN